MNIFLLKCGSKSVSGIPAILKRLEIEWNCTGLHGQLHCLYAVIGTMWNALNKNKYLVVFRLFQTLSLVSITQLWNECAASQLQLASPTNHSLFESHPRNLDPTTRPIKELDRRYERSWMFQLFHIILVTTRLAHKQIDRVSSSWTNMNKWTRNSTR